MALEDKIDALVVALDKNTAAHAKLAEVAMAASGGTSKPASTETSKATAAKAKEAEVEETEEAEEAEETPAAKKKRLAAEKKAAAAAAEKKAAAAAAKNAKAPEVVGSMTLDELKPIAAGFMKGDDEEVREANKAKFASALEHLGASKLTEVADDEDRARLAAYIGHWSAGLDVDFEAVDELVAAASGDGDGDDDMLG